MCATLQAKPVSLVLWHSLAGDMGVALNDVIAGFNEYQSDYVIKPIYKGNYSESLTSFAAAFRAHQPPALVQVFEVGTATMLQPKGVIKPLDELMQEQGMSIPLDDFFPAVRASYSEQGHLMAMPLNISVPALFYNADALAKVGYSADNFPRTWSEFEQLAKKLHDAGFPCAYTTAYPAWILIESYSAVHGLPMMDQTATHAIYNNSQMINQLTRIRDWQRKHYFEYGGRTDDATILFTSGRCPLMSQSSGAYASLSQWVSFRVGIAAMPLDTKVSDKRFNNVTGGAALWAVVGQSVSHYRGIAQFFTYLSKASVQQQWHQRTGYLPLGVDGVYRSLLKKTQQHPALSLAVSEWGRKQATRPGFRYGAQSQIRTINDEALEALFAGIKSPQGAMDDAVKRADQALLRFQLNTAIQ